MRRDFRLYLDDILESINQIRAYTADQSEETFANDRKTQDAVIRNLEIIGEAAGNIPEQIKKMEPEIDWRKISGLRNILIHEYFGINCQLYGMSFKINWNHWLQFVLDFLRITLHHPTRIKTFRISMLFAVGI